MKRTSLKNSSCTVHKHNSYTHTFIKYTHAVRHNEQIYRSVVIIIIIIVAVVLEGIQVELNVGMDIRKCYVFFIFHHSNFLMSLLVLFSAKLCVAMVR